MKKVVLSVASIALSLGLAGAVGAQEKSVPVSPNQSNALVESSTIITPNNLTKYFETSVAYTKADYPNQTNLPTSIRKTINDANGVWTGTLFLKDIKVYGTYYLVFYGGTLTLY